MGLDMYLTAKRYLSTYNAEDKFLAEKVGNMPDLKNGLMRVKEVSCELMYWRKANAIHRWFVENVQENEDDCRSHYVPSEKLIELREMCSEALKNRDKAGELLPTQEGFFFGSTSIDDDYFVDMADTMFGLENIEQLEADGWEFFYCSSW